MSKIFEILRDDDATLLYIFDYIAFGFIHQRSMNKVRGIIIGIWRFQLQISLGYSKETVEEGKAGHA
jgi:hypothetical protein